MAHFFKNPVLFICVTRDIKKRVMNQMRYWWGDKQVYAEVARILHHASTLCESQRFCLKNSRLPIACNSSFYFRNDCNEIAGTKTRSTKREIENMWWQTRACMCDKSDCSHLRCRLIAERGLWRSFRWYSWNDQKIRVTIKAWKMSRMKQKICLSQKNQPKVAVSLKTSKQLISWRLQK